MMGGVTRHMLPHLHVNRPLVRIQTFWGGKLQANEMSWTTEKPIYCSTEIRLIILSF